MLAHPIKIFWGVDPCSWRTADEMYGNREAMPENTQLLERLEFFEWRHFERGISLQKILTVGVEADMTQGSVTVRQCRG